jgi:hypothetical protein
MDFQKKLILKNIQIHIKVKNFKFKLIEFISERILEEFHPSKLKIAIVSSGRAEYLYTLFRSLRQVLYFEEKNTILFQYGDNREVNEMVNSFGIEQIKHPINKIINGGILNYIMSLRGSN